jgi:hypothetical protein
MGEASQFRLLESTPGRRPSKTVEIDSYWESIKPNPNLLNADPVEDEPQKKYKRGCPPDRALVVLHEGKSEVLEYIGPGLDYLADDCMLRDEIDSFCEGLSGVFILEGRMISTGPDYNGEYDAYFEGDFRVATKEEWAAHLNGEYIWDESLWYESESVGESDAK